MFVLLAGCATHKPLTALPKSTNEFTENKEYLANKYSDIVTYEKRWRGFSANYPLEENIVNHLGSPKKIKRDWWYPIVMVGTIMAVSTDPITWGITLGLVLAVRPDMPKTYYFEKERYCIATKIDRTFVSGYKPYMVSWAWEENKEKCN